MEQNLEPIVEYNMDRHQALAYKLGLIWLELRLKTFPDYLHSKGYPKKGDPRKCSLFKYCHKFERETRGLLALDEYRLFIIAQLQILKSIDLGGRHPRIEPICLCGDSAWVRWKIWKKKYDTMSKRTTKEDVGLDVTPYEVVVRELNSTKKFLEGRFGGPIREENVMMAAKEIERWIKIGKISMYYAILSLFVGKHCKDLVIDMPLYEKSITKEVKEYFLKEFDEKPLA